MRKKRILIVNCYFDELRVQAQRKIKVPQTITPAYLAGLFSPRHCEIRLYNEHYSGHLESEELFSWPDMVVLTGLNTAFDRMLHITAYIRTRNRDAIIVAGGPAIRALYNLSRTFFDYSCTGDIEQLAEVIEDAFGKKYVSEQFREDGWVMPRFDLMYWMRNPAFLESTRNCYNNCSFCSLTAEDRGYRQYDLEYVRRQFLALGKRKVVLFLDNNFGSVGARYLAERFELLGDLRERGFFWRWGALVSNDFFRNDDNIRKSRETGCLTLFSGVETFDRQSLIGFRKYQNTRQPQLEIIRRCLDADIVFYYGMVFDISKRSLAELVDEIDFFLGIPEITLPSYISLAIPILGTPYFHECLEQKKILPNVKIRDLDSTTITLKPVDPLPDAVRFVRDLQTLTGFKRKIAAHSRRFYLQYRNRLSFMHMLLALHNALLLSVPRLTSARSDVGNIALRRLQRRPRTHIGATEELDAAYTPIFRVDSRFERFFRPTMLTDHEGNLAEELWEDLAVPRSKADSRRISRESADRTGNPAIACSPPLP